jgi:hypothetical protein
VTPAPSPTAELAALIPALPVAIERDNTAAGRTARASGGFPVNTDVFYAILTLSGEIPAAAATAAGLVGERWQARPPGLAIGAVADPWAAELLRCLTALDRFTHRMHALRMAEDAQAAEDDVRRWTRKVKLALGLRRPERPLGATCPYCPGDLMAAGAERYADFTRGVVVGDWVEARRIYCTLDHGHEWPEEHWALLGDMLLQAAV